MLFGNLGLQLDEIEMKLCFARLLTNLVWAMLFNDSETVLPNGWRLQSNG